MARSTIEVPWDADCPCRDNEFFVCNITGTKCPKHIETDDLDDMFDFPDDCPARKGIQIKI